jgi:hypothetical protein
VQQNSAQIFHDLLFKVEEIQQFSEEVPNL